MITSQNTVMLPSEAMGYSASNYRDSWFAWCEPYTQVSDVVKSTFWAHHMAKLKPGALIELATRDGFFDVDVRILSVINGIVRCNVIRHFEREEERADIIEAWLNRTEGEAATPGFERARQMADLTPDGYKVGFHPGNSTFYVYYKVTGQKLVEGLSDPNNAVRAARAHARLAGQDIPMEDIDKVPEPKGKSAKAA